MRLPLWTIYRALWTKAESDGVFVRYGEPREGVDGGSFEIENHRPTVTVFRAFSKVLDKPVRGRSRAAPATMPAPDLVAELFVLARELGHVQRWREGRDPRDIQDVAVLHEEARAWTIARALLARQGFEDWPTFEAYRAAAMDRFALALGLTVTSNHT